MKRALILVCLVAVVALPFALRPERVAVTEADDTVVIITPHNEAIRFEYGRAFAEWYRARTGRTVAVDWRVIGGTSEIARFLEGEYVAAFEHHWTRKLGRPWSAEVQAAFQNGRLPSEATATAREAREEFLRSEVSSGIDVFFGGGTFDFQRQAAAGRLVSSGMLERHPGWFADGTIPRHHLGEEFWDQDGLWFGTVVSSYGIVFNRDALARLGFAREPRTWADLTDRKLLGEVALADPTKSASVAKAFENIVQQQIQRRWRESGGGGGEAEARAVREGWLAGLRLIQLAGANARYFTDTSQKPPIDVAAGNCALGLCIDFYGRQQQEAVRRRGAADVGGEGGLAGAAAQRVGYVPPAGGSVYSVDPIGMLRGAPHREVAVAFIEYALSLDGQKLWNFEVGAPGGPERFALRRLPVRRDFYTREEWRQWRTDPEESPYAQDDPLIYRPEWTEHLFRELAFVVRVMCLDTHGELRSAWRAIAAAPEGRRAEALAALSDLSAVAYARAGDEIKRALSSRDKVDEVRMAKRLGDAFRRNYARAEAIARGEGEF